MTGCRDSQDALEIQRGLLRTVQGFAGQNTREGHKSTQTFHNGWREHSSRLRQGSTENHSGVTNEHTSIV